MPRFGSTTNSYYDAARYFYDGSYIRLKNIEVSYTFTNGWIKSLGLSNLKLYVMVITFGYGLACLMTVNQTSLVLVGLHKVLILR